VFENRMQRRIFGLKRNEVTARWRKLHKKDRDLYSSPNIIRTIKSRRVRCEGHVARMREKRYTYRLLMGRPEGRRPLGRQICRWVDNMRMDLGEIGWCGLDCSGSG
jgi:hypothetical protein